MEGLKVLGHRVLVKLDIVEEVSDGGIVLATNYDSDLKSREEAATTTGTIVSIGKTAWTDPGLGAYNWAELGERVIFAKYGSKIVTDPRTGENYAVVNDEDIIISYIDSGEE